MVPMICFVVICRLSMNFEKKTLDTNCTASRGASTDCGAKAKDPNVNKLPKTKMTVPMATMCVWFVRFLSSLPSVSLLCCTDWDASSEALSAASDILLIEGIDLSFWFSISLAASLP